jgi:hypothetical protein
MIEPNLEVTAHFARAIYYHWRGNSICYVHLGKAIKAAERAERFANFVDAISRVKPITKVRFDSGASKCFEQEVSGGFDREPEDI